MTLWDNSKRAQLYDTLNTVARNFYIPGMYVTSVQEIKGYEAIQLCFPNEPSGLMHNHKENGGKAGHIMRMGGGLIFQQITTGDVLIWMEYPYIQFNGNEEAKHEILKSIPMQSLNDEEVFSAVIWFMDNINKHISNSQAAVTERNLIGFKGE